MSQKPPIGDFKVHAAQQDAKIDKDARETEAALKPHETYAAALKTIGVTREDAAEIMDNVLFKGYHTEKYVLSPRTSVTFRSRQYTDTERLQAYLEATRPMYDSSISEITYRYLLAGSLAAFKTDTFEFPDANTPAEKANALFETRLAYIRALPDVVVRILFDKLRKFDEKLSVCLQTGSVENF